MEHLPLVSVIMPVHNGERYIKEALVSILEQTYPNLEIIVCDDASTDATVQCVEEIQQINQKNNIHIIHQAQNQGIANNMNTGLEAASGKYIAVLDHDDKRLNTHKIRHQVHFLENNPNHGIIGTNTIVNIGNNMIKNEYPIVDKDIRDVILGKCPMLHSAVMYHKTLATEVGGYSHKYECAPDYDLFLKIMRESKGANLFGNMTYYRVHSTSISTMKNKKQKKEALQLTRENRNNFPNTSKALIYRTGSLISSVLLPNTEYYKHLQLLIKSNY